MAVGTAQLDIADENGDVYCACGERATALVVLKVNDEWLVDAECEKHVMDRQRALKSRFMAEYYIVRRSDICRAPAPLRTGEDCG